MVKCHKCGFMVNARGFCPNCGWTEKKIRKYKYKNKSEA